MKKSLIFTLILTVLFLTSGQIFGQEISLPNGQSMSLNGLTEVEKKDAIALFSKVANAQQTAKKEKAEIAKTAAEIISDPDKLQSWVNAITGAIKQICSDLNVTTNEFIQTPVGMGIAALIAYKVVGKDLIQTVFRTIIIIPFWIIFMIILFYLQKKYLSYITIYKKKETTGDKIVKTIYSEPERVESYEWQSKDARTTFTVFLYGTMIVMTLICLFTLV